LHPEPIAFFDLKSQNKNCFWLRPETFSPIANCPRSADIGACEFALAAGGLQERASAREKNQGFAADNSSDRWHGIAITPATTARKF
jgi:hypothetical protein